MKTRILICITALMLLNSCIVNSLFPFFTEATISFEKKFIGIWNGGNSSERWIINSVADINKIEKENDLDFYEKYKNGYYVIYEEIKENRTSVFLAIPFKINNQLFLDFIPFFYDNEKTNQLISHHLIPTHSLVKFDILDNNTIGLKWLSSDKLAELIENNKIKINHEKIAVNDSKYLLTASSEELQKFIKKYMASKDVDKWKTDVSLDLKRTGSYEESLKLIKKVMKSEVKLSGKSF